MTDESNNWELEIKFRTICDLLEFPAAEVNLPDRLEIIGETNHGRAEYWREQTPEQRVVETTTFENYSKTIVNGTHNGVNKYNLQFQVPHDIVEEEIDRIQGNSPVDSELTKLIYSKLQSREADEGMKVVHVNNIELDGLEYLAVGQMR